MFHAMRIYIYMRKYRKTMWRKQKNLRKESDFLIFATRCRRPKIFQTLNYVRSNNLSFYYQRFTP